MDSVTAVSLNGKFLLSSLSIILINIVLSGDNSVVIAMAVHSLPKDKRMRGILFGTFGAVLLRVAFTWFAARLLQTPFLKIAGGALIIWIAVKLLLEDAETDAETKSAETIWHAVWIILAADLTMSLDNVLAVAGASEGNILELWLSLGLSIPLVIFASAVLSKLMDRFPLILYVGAALLGKVAGEMMITDPVITSWLRINSISLRVSWELLCTFGVLAIAWKINQKAKEETPEQP